jgi:hypothetical protein
MKVLINGADARIPVSGLSWSTSTFMCVAADYTDCYDYNNQLYSSTTLTGSFNNWIITGSSSFMYGYEYCWRSAAAVSIPHYAAVPTTTTTFPLITNFVTCAG